MTLLVATAVRFLLFPHFEERYFISTYLICTILGVITVLGSPDRISVIASGYTIPSRSLEGSLVS